MNATIKNKSHLMFVFISVVMFLLSVKLIWFCAFYGTLVNDVNVLFDRFHEFVKF
jgi:hypothetical protein